MRIYGRAASGARGKTLFQIRHLFGLTFESYLPTSRRSHGEKTPPPHGGERDEEVFRDMEAWLAVGGRSRNVRSGDSRKEDGRERVRIKRRELKRRSGKIGGIVGSLRGRGDARERKIEKRTRGRVLTKSEGEPENKESDLTRGRWREEGGGEGGERDRTKEGG